MTDLMAGGGEEDEVAGPFFRGDGTGKGQKVADARPALATTTVPACHRRRDHNGRPLARAEPGHDVAAGDILLVMADDIQRYRRARGHRALKHSPILSADDDHRHGPRLVLLRHVIGKTVIAGIADREQDRRGTASS